MTAESAKLKHHHHHHADLELPNPHAHQGPEERFENLLMMLEAQFGSDISPIERPRIPSGIRANGTIKGDPSISDAVKTESDAAGETLTESQGGIDEDEEEESTEEIEAAELARLQALGIPYPGIEIKVDKHVARVWLENLEVDCANAVLRDRVRVVIERAVETVASMWGEGPRPAPIANGTQGTKEVALSKSTEIQAKA
jgi:cleavage and polyadenylation specificity factor subunit 3